MDVRSSMREKIAVRPVTGRSATGDPVYGAAELEVPARVERLAEVVAGADGTTLQESHRLFTVRELKKSDLVFLEGEDSSDTDKGHNVTRVEAMKDLDGLLSHYESYF